MRISERLLTVLACCLLAAAIPAHAGGKGERELKQARALVEQQQYAKAMTLLIEMMEKYPDLREATDELVARIMRVQELYNQKYREFLGFEVASVWLTTPARYFGSRFGAIATYELMDGEAERRAWILEAGMATGEAMVLYTSPHGQPIERVSWYQPTPFSAPTNWYRGAATFDEAGPRSLHVQVSTPAEREQKKSHVEVAVAYEAVAQAEAPAVPAQITAEAAMRVAAIAVARGDMNPVYLALAPFGHGLDWVKRP